MSGGNKTNSSVPKDITRSQVKYNPKLAEIIEEIRKNSFETKSCTADKNQGPKDNDSKRPSQKPTSSASTSRK